MEHALAFGLLCSKQSCLGYENTQLEREGSSGIFFLVQNIGHRQCDQDILLYLHGFSLIGNVPVKLRSLFPAYVKFCMISLKVLYISCIIGGEGKTQKHFRSLAELE